MTLAHHQGAKTPNPKLILTALIATAALAGGTIGLTSVRQAKLKDIQQAQAMLQQSCQTNLNNQAAITSAAQTVGNATQLLQQVPKLPGFGYEEAQAVLTTYATCSQRIQAADLVVQARSLNQRILDINSNSVLPAAEWRTLQSDLTKVIDRLKTVPKNLPMAKQAQGELATAQKQLQTVNVRLQSEETATNQVNQAEALYRESELGANSKGNVQALLIAQEKLKSALEILKTLPENTTALDRGQQNLPVYQERLRDLEMQYALSQLRPLLQSFSQFAASVDASMEYHVYSEQLSDLKTQFDRLVPPGTVNQHPSFIALTSAIAHYDDALTVWRYSHEGNGYNSAQALIVDFRGNVTWLPADFKIKDKLLKEKYGTIALTRNILGQNYIQLNEALTKIWAQAAQKVQEAKRSQG